jgi:hypothetical protein
MENIYNYQKTKDIEKLTTMISEIRFMIKTQEEECSNWFWKIWKEELMEAGKR